LEPKAVKRALSALSYRSLLYKIRDAGLLSNSPLRLGTAENVENPRVAGRLTENLLVHHPEGFKQTILFAIDVAMELLLYANICSSPPFDY